ncbi:hypothetical protein BGE01nite_45700 [Brevifollis gellanilyticus]|uniref:Uncharacterized protein n=2 Tax=Brevifollis gellanilyticus TaxID=748831 RepID=A0A512MEV8_9BACT|nr:hypothetical protein BGE01nite_45700 [Brevifollis gellanilyticus]
MNILHYIGAHWYQPPPEYIAAVEACPPQRSAAYLKLLLSSGGRKWLKSFDEPPPGTPIKQANPNT